MRVAIGRRLVACSPLIFLIRLARTAEPRSSWPSAGTLLVVGGGRTSAPVIEAAIRTAGGPGARWVVIPSAQEDRQLSDPKVPDFIRERGNFTLLHTRDRAVANTEAFVAPLLGAQAVWFDGGRQWRLADTYGETRTEQALHALLARGGLIAGSSAGATIMGSFLVRGARSGNDIVMAPGQERGFGFMRNVAIDQHIGTRHREADLAQVVAAHPDVLGIGIDEGTAILVRGNGFVVIGPSIVAITDGAMHQGKSYYVLRQGDRFDLATWKALPAA
jgi:cyanophycinase